MTVCARCGVENNTNSEFNVLVQAHSPVVVNNL